MDDPSQIVRALRGTDFRLNMALDTYDVFSDSRVFLLLAAVDVLEADGKKCVGDLVTMKDSDLQRKVGAEGLDVLRQWQEEVIGIPRDAKVFGWVRTGPPLRL